MTALAALAAALVGYLLGSVPSAALAARLRGKDILREGSGNPGATNALRVLGPLPAVLVLAADVAKGLLAAYVGWRLGGIWGTALAGLAAGLGHAYSIFLRGRGGKVVAVSLGVLAFWDLRLVLVALVAFAVVLAVSRIVSLSSLVAALAAAGWALIGVEPMAWQLRAAVVCLVALLFWRHRGNIERLRHGEERRLGRSG